MISKNNTDDKLTFSVELAMKTSPRTAIIHSIMLDHTYKGMMLYVPGTFLTAYPFLSRNGLETAIKELQDLGLLVPVNDKYKKVNLIAKTNSVYGMSGIAKCEWCQSNTYTIEQHHFPISRADGGTELVNICPNCHALFHRSDLFIVKEGEYSE